MYLLDDLKALNVGEMANWKIHNYMKQIVSSGDFGLSISDLHIRGDQRLSPVAVLARIVASMIQLIFFKAFVIIRSYQKFELIVN